MELTPEIVRELLHYDPETGIFTWRERERHWFRRDIDWLAWNGKHASRRAGCVWTNPITGFRRRHISILRKQRLEHAIAWMWMTDEPLPPQIDHKSRDATDNRWNNIRASTNAKNCLNRSRRLTNRSGITGVSWYSKAGKWRARCTVAGKTYHLGLFERIEDAKREVTSFRSANGFEPGHGAKIAHYHQ